MNFRCLNYITSQLLDFCVFCIKMVLCPLNYQFAAWGRGYWKFLVLRGSSGLRRSESRSIQVRLRCGGQMKGSYRQLAIEEIIDLWAQEEAGIMEEDNWEGILPYPGNSWESKCWKLQIQGNKKTGYVLPVVVWNSKTSFKSDAIFPSNLGQEQCFRKPLGHEVRCFPKKTHQQPAHTRNRVSALGQSTP